MTDTLDLYVTNTETIYPDYDDPFRDVAIRLYGRTETGDAKRVTVTGFDPYFYVPSDQQDVLKTGEHDDLERYETIDVIPLEDRFAASLPWREERTLAKVVASHPGAVPKLRDHWETTWGADVAFTNRFRIDKNIRTGSRIALGDADPDNDHFIVDESRVAPVEMDEDPRVCIFDIETDDRDTGFPDAGDARVLSIVAYDSYDDEYVGFLDMDGTSIEEKFDVADPPEDLADLGIEQVDSLHYERDERRMLIAFASWVSDRNPDIIGGWNSGDSNADGFDFPHLIKRMDEVGANPDRLSREGYVDIEQYRGDWSVEIRGRSTYDFMNAWASTKFTEPDSMKLDRVAADKLDDAKIEHPDMGYYEMYEHDPALFLNYNGKDTRLTADIVEAEDVIGFKKRLKDMVGVDWEEVRQNNDFVSMSVRRKCHEYGLTMVTARDNPRVREAASSSDSVNYEGAWVFPAFEGVKENIVGVDLASLYPMTQWMLNASPDTKINAKKAWQHDIEQVVAANDVAFSIDHDSIIRELVDEYDEIKMEYKRKLKTETPGTEAHDTMSLLYGVAKTIYNCVTGDHEVMTADGVVNIKDVEVGDEVYSLDPETGRVELKEVTKTFAYPDYDGELIEIDTDSIAQTLTPNHRAIVRQNDGYVQDDQYHFVEAGDLKQSAGYEMPTSVGSNPNIHGPGMDTFSIADKEAIGGYEVRVHPEVHGRTFTSNLSDDVEVEYDDNTSAYFMDVDDYLAHQQTIEEMCEEKTTEVHAERNQKFVPVFYDGDAFVELLAWYVTEGSVYRGRDTVQVNIAQREAGDRPAIRDVLERCGLDYKEDEPQLWFTSRILGDLLEDLCGSGSENKRLPEFVWDLSPDQKRLLFRTLIAGDGDKGQNRYSTQSEDLRDDFMRLAVEFGQNVRYHHEESWDGYRVRWNEANNHFRMNRSSERREAGSDEGVYCITVEGNHTMLCGRDGSFSWTGQSFYGYTGWDKSPMYDPEIAAAVTLTGQRVIKRTAEWLSENSEGDIVYGDTDSNYVEFPAEWSQERTLNYAESLCERLTNDVYPDLCDEFLIPSSDNRWEIELEMRAERMFMHGKKKNYSYLEMWEEGMDFDEFVNDGDGKFSVTGYPVVKSNFSAITKETMGDVLETIVRGGSREQVADIMFEAASSIDAADPDWERLGIPQGLGKKIDREKADNDEHYNWSTRRDTPQGAHPRGVWFANKLLDVEYAKGSKPMRAYTKETLVADEEPVDVICYEYEHHLDAIADDLQMDVPTMQEKTLLNPMDDILYAFDMEPEAALQGNAQRQAGLEAFT